MQDRVRRALIHYNMKDEIISSYWWHRLMKSPWHHPANCPSNSLCSLNIQTADWCSYSRPVFMTVWWHQRSQIRFMAPFYATTPPSCEVNAMGWNKRRNVTLRGAVCGCAWNCKQNLKHHKFGLLCCVCVCLCKCEWSGSLLSCDALKCSRGNR